ncbi:MAG: DUF4340 domain-containing protein [Coprococcus sp.]
MSFTKDDGEWVYDEDDGVRLNQSTIKSTATEITGLTAVRKLSDPDEKADYGLDSSDYMNYLHGKGWNQRNDSDW